MLSYAMIVLEMHVHSLDYFFSPALHNFGLPLFGFSTTPLSLHTHARVALYDYLNSILQMIYVVLDALSVPSEATSLGHSAYKRFACDSPNENVKFCRSTLLL